MNGILEIQEKVIKFELENLTYNQFKMIGSKPMDVNNIMIEKYSIGEPITLITSNMPDNLKHEIDKMIEQYCNQ